MVDFARVGAKLAAVERQFAHAVVARQPGQQLGRRSARHRGPGIGHRRLNVEGTDRSIHREDRRARRESAAGDPRSVRAPREARAVDAVAQDADDRPPPQGFEGQEPSLDRVGRLEALAGVGEGRRRVVAELQPAQGYELARPRPGLVDHGTLEREVRAPEEDADHRQDQQERGEDAGDGRVPQAATALDPAHHGARELLFQGGERPGVALAPERELAEGRSRPEEVRGPPLLVPEVRGLPQLVAQQRPLCVLRLPADEPGPGPQERLVDRSRPGSAGRPPARAPRTW